MPEEREPEPTATPRIEVVGEDEPVETEGATGPGKKRFKVGVVIRHVQIRTIWANSAQEAVRLVIEDNQGRPAGTEGPEMHVALAMPIDDPFSFLEILKNMESQPPPPEPKKPDGKIIIPGFIPPDDIRGKVN